MGYNEIQSIFSHFGIRGEVMKVTPVCEGLINVTRLVEFDENRKYMLQRINTYVFKNPDELMENIVGVTEFIKNEIKKTGGDIDREVLSFVKCDNGKYFYTDSDGSCWRVYKYIDNSLTYNRSDSAAKFESAGRAFGRFMKLLADYPAQTLHETIENFHNTAVRYAAFVSAVNEDVCGRKAKVESEIKFVTDREEDAGKLVRLLSEGKLPMRVTHNDTKLNNVLFDIDTDESICVIDIDTVMPGLSLYDFGDSIRSGANTAAEDEKDLDKVELDLALFKGYAKGYLSQTKDFLTDTEKENLVFSSKLMTFECGMRFLTDYLNGDRYFRIDYPEHNLVRARNQFKLVSDIEKKSCEMEKIINNLT